MKTHTISEQVNLFVKKVFESIRSCQYPNYHMMLISFLSFRSEFCTLGLPKLSILEASLHLSTFETVFHSIFNDETRQLPHNCSTSITQTYKHLHLYVFFLQKQSMIFLNTTRITNYYLQIMELAYKTFFFVLRVVLLYLMTKMTV